MHIPNPASLFKQNVHQWIYFSGLALMAASMPNSVFFMSVGQFVIAGNWLLEGKYKEKLNRFAANKPAILLTLLFFMYLLSGLWSENTTALVKELRNKIPILTLTFLVASSPTITQRKRKWALLLLFIASVVVTTIIGVALYNPETALTSRSFSPFISHIRFGMMIVLSIFLLPWLLHRVKSDFSQQLDGYQQWLKPIALLVISWLLVYLFLLQALSSFVFLGFCLVFSGVYLLKHYTLKWVYSAISSLGILISAGILVTIIWLLSLITIQHPVNFEMLPSHTTSGNPYIHDTILKDRENGHLVFMFIAEDELRESWNLRSTIDYKEKDKRGQELRFTLFRYLASKGLTKDYDGIKQLSPDDINAIENGIANYHYVQWPGIVVRIHQSIWEIDQYQDGRVLDEHSLTKRFEFWKAAVTAIRSKPNIGWGAGDLKSAMFYGFTTNRTILNQQFWHNPHNQYLLWAVIFGIPATIGILILLLWIPIATGVWKEFPVRIFLIIFFLSMFSEDTMQTQAGITFFIFFYLFFNFIFPNEKNEQLQKG